MNSKSWLRIPPTTRCQVSGLYEGKEYQYWQKVSALKGKLDLLSRLPEPAIERAARILLDLRESWEWATREERKMLVRTMIQEAGCDVGTKRIVWVKARPDYEPLFVILQSELAQLTLSDLGRKPSVGKDHITKRVRPAMMCSYCHSVTPLRRESSDLRRGWVPHSTVGIIIKQSLYRSFIRTNTGLLAIEILMLSDRCARHSAIVEVECDTDKNIE